MREITDHMLPLLLWFLALMALGEEYKMSVHVYFIFPTQHKHILRKKRSPFLFCIPAKCCFTTCVFHTQPNQIAFCVLANSCTHAGTSGGNFGVFVVTFQSQLVSGAPASGDGPHAAVCLMWCLNPDSINAEALWNGSAVKEHQKTQFRPRPRGSITAGWSWQTIRSSFSEDDTSTSSSSSCHLLAALQTRPFVWSTTFDLLLYFLGEYVSYPFFSFCFGQDVRAFDTDPSSRQIFFFLFVF